MNSSSTSALVEGPYGRGYDFRKFGTVVMFASGIGILAHLPYLDELVPHKGLHEDDQFRTMTRDILLIWYDDGGFPSDSIKPFMDNLLERDKGGEKAARPIGSSESLERPGDRPEPIGENVVHPSLPNFLQS
jgi:hypothetical protein